MDLNYILGGIKISELIANKWKILDDGAFLAQAGALTEKFEELKRLKLEKAG